MYLDLRDNRLGARQYCLGLGIFYCRRAQPKLALDARHGDGVSWQLKGQQGGADSATSKGWNEWLHRR
jgi:hypothetical protein